MAEKDLFMKVEEVAKELGISKSHAYKIMQKLNAELKEKGFLTVAGRVNRKYFMEKFCYGGKD
ncbi:MAG: DNA-binding protein [Eubacteriales bacterium]